VGGLLDQTIITTRASIAYPENDILLLKLKFGKERVYLYTRRERINRQLQLTDSAISSRKKTYPNIQNKVSSLSDLSIKQLDTNSTLANKKETQCQSLCSPQSSFRGSTSTPPYTTRFTSHKPRKQTIVLSLVDECQYYTRQCTTHMVLYQS
jgi:hypothetical protein